MGDKLNYNSPVKDFIFMASILFIDHRIHKANSRSYGSS
jgi:hypothetical protein